jgi:hypothetical protein
MFIPDGDLEWDRVWDVDEQARNPRWRRATRSILPASARRLLHMWFGDLWVAYRKDRIYLDCELIPAVGRRGGIAPLIGCRKYTQHYPTLLAAHGVECWTIHIDPIAARWGARKRHVIGDIRDAQHHWAPSAFSTVILNFGLNNVRDQDAALRACRRLLTEGSGDDWRSAKHGNGEGRKWSRKLDRADGSAHRSVFQPSINQPPTHVYGTFAAVEVSDMSPTGAGWT